MTKKKPKLRKDGKVDQRVNNSRPLTPNLDEKQLKQVEKISSLGLSAEHIAGCLSMSRAAFFELMKRQPEIRQTIEKGKSLGIAKMANCLGYQAQQGNVAAIIFYLKTQARWKEDQPQLQNNIVIQTEITKTGEFKRLEFNADDDVIDIEAQDQEATT